MAARTLHGPEHVTRHRIASDLGKRGIRHGQASKENNPIEVFWLTGLTSWAIVAVPIDIDRRDQEVMADVRRVWEICRDDVKMGTAPEGEVKDAIARLHAKGLSD